MSIYQGSCHCQAVAYQVELENINAVSCNCSICQRKGTLLAFAPGANFTLLRGQENLSDYQFGKKQIHHLFCKTCGISSFSRGSDNQENSSVAINLRCIEGIDPNTLKVTEYNGRDV